MAGSERRPSVRRASLPIFCAPEPFRGEKSLTEKRDQLRLDARRSPIDATWEKGRARKRVPPKGHFGLGDLDRREGGVRDLLKQRRGLEAFSAQLIRLSLR